MPQPFEKHRKRKIRTRNYDPKQEDRRSIRLTARVEGISTNLMLRSILFILPGGGFPVLLVVSLLKSIFTNSNTTLSDYTPFAFIVLFLLALLLVGLFILKVAFDFRSFKSWTFYWAQLFLTRNFSSTNDFNDPDIRRAFKQPQFVYPEHPEYGYKLEDENNGKKS